MTTEIDSSPTPTQFWANDDSFTLSATDVNTKYIALLTFMYTVTSSIYTSQYQWDGVKKRR